MFLLWLRMKGSDGTRRNRKGGLHRVTDRLEQHAAMSRDGSTEKGEVALNGGDHCLAVPFPERRAALDVGEEEGNGPGGEVGHDPLQILGWTWCCSIVAWRGSEDGSDTHHLANDLHQRNR
jgi:hypothetical protein